MPFRRAGELADRHGLTLYDAAYAAVAEGREATLVPGVAEETDDAP